MIYIVITEKPKYIIAYNKAKLRQVCEDLELKCIRFTVIKGSVIDYEEELQ